MKVLIVEDERKVASLLRIGLSEHGFVVDVVHSGNSGLTSAIKGGYDVIVLDVLLPGINGFEVLAKLRENRNTTPVLLLTALGEVQDKIKGLNLGGDDYLTKPFDFDELLARINALVRRSGVNTDEMLSAGDLVLDKKTHRVKRDGKDIELTTKEFQLLVFLLEHKNQVITRAMISQHVWDIAFDTGTNVIEVYINYLRRKIDRDTDTKLIQTIRGVGYMLSDP